ncbi:helix-turn-helix domain-containing protein [Catenovulum agarivorans]|uniref:helix-turn-helix domain-containing protein n=1 Tax=Catenovulum agarivorans TaxID=1172192 RepID=UPI0003684AD4|nr:AraC family transcriptional regulator [Catenovulum agarivorans]
MIVLSDIQIIDLLFRCTSIGILLSSILLVWRGRTGGKSNTVWPVISCLSCIISYILLTSPIDDDHYGGVRHLLLLMTDASCFAVLWLAKSLLNPKFTLAKLDKRIFVPLGLYLLWLVYLFLVLGGRSIMHDVNHVVGLAIFLYVIYLCLSEYFDDLDNQRRNYRLLLTVICVSYMSALSLFELVFNEVRNTWQFSLVNSIGVFVIAGFYLFQRMQQWQLIPVSVPSPSQTQSSKVLKLNQLMAEGAFLQSNLTIGELASQLGMPAHQLRLVINSELGFSNFSNYLNSYRIPYVCEQLKQPSKMQTPVLTLALEAGYGSIAPFNRAFKQQIGMTPTQYRNQF